MTYVDCLIAAVPTASKQVYSKHAKLAGDIFKKLGALKPVEHCGDDIQEGEVTSLSKALRCKPDETVVFSWISWPSNDARNTGMQGVTTDPAMEETTMFVCQSMQGIK